MSIIQVDSWHYERINLSCKNHWNSLTNLIVECQPQELKNSFAVFEGASTDQLKFLKYWIADEWKAYSDNEKFDEFFAIWAHGNKINFTVRTEKSNKKHEPDDFKEKKCFAGTKVPEEIKVFLVICNHTMNGWTFTSINDYFPFFSCFRS